MNLGRLRRTLPAASAVEVGIVERDGGVWHLFSDGGLLPVVRGGAPDDPPKEDPPKEDPPKTFTQAEVDRMLAREKDQGERAGETKGMRKALEQLGVDPDKVKPEDLKATLTAALAAEDAQKTEAQKAKDAADAAKAESDREKATAAADRHQANLERYLIRAGVGGGETDDTKLAKAIERASRLVDVEPGAEPEKIQTAVADLKKDMPALFTASSGEQPHGDAAGQTRGAGDGKKSGVERGKAKAAELGWTKPKEKQTA